MTIQEALRDPILQVRVVCGDRWLVWDDKDGYVVYSRPYKARRTRELIHTADEAEAVAVLTNAQEEIK